MAPERDRAGPAQRNAYRHRHRPRVTDAVKALLSGLQEGDPSRVRRDTIDVPAQLPHRVLRLDPSFAALNLAPVHRPRGSLLPVLLNHQGLWQPARRLDDGARARRARRSCGLHQVIAGWQARGLGEHRPPRHRGPREGDALFHPATGRGPATSREAG